MLKVSSKTTISFVNEYDEAVYVWDVTDVETDEVMFDSVIETATIIAQTILDAGGDKHFVKTALDEFIVNFVMDNELLSEK